MASASNYDPEYLMYGVADERSTWPIVWTMYCGVAPGLAIIVP
jgi:hypothetical protein